MNNCTNQILVNDWYIVSKATELQQGGIKPVRLLGEDIVVWRGSSLESPVLAWQDWCPHRGAALSLGKVVGDRLACRYHGWQYDKTGKCVCVPSLPRQLPAVGARVKTYKCKESRGYIWVSLGNPVQDVSPFPEWNNPDNRQLICGPYYVRSSPFRVIENNLDISHIAFLHEGTIGNPDYPFIGDYQIKSEKTSITITNLEFWQKDADYTTTNVLSKANLKMMKVDSPLSLRGFKEIENSSKIVCWSVNVTPIEEESCLMWIAFAMNYGYEIPELEIQTSTDKFFREDVLILESQRPARLPLLPRKDTDTQWPPEVQVHCDRASVAYRRWLKSLGITFGVC